MTHPFLPYGRQWIDDDDIAAVTAVLKSDYLTTGPMVTEFEQALAARVGAAQAISCSSGTAALHLAAMALDLEPDDLVVVPAMTFMAAANAVRLAGAEVLFADVDPQNGLMGPGQLSQALKRAEGRRVRAAIPVHLNGQAADMEALAEVSEGQGLTLVEDAAHALGTSVTAHGVTPRPVGSCRYSAMSIFSFHPVKAITQGEGGALTTNNSKLAARLRRLRSHGITRDSQDFRCEGAFDSAGHPNPWHHEMDEPGLNYRASDIHCALGLRDRKSVV